MEVYIITGISRLHCRLEQISRKLFCGFNTGIQETSMIFGRRSLSETIHNGIKNFLVTARII